MWLWVVGLVALARAQDLTLPDAIDLAMERNIAVRQARLRLHNRDKAVMAAHGSMYDPTLSVDVSTGASRSPNNDENLGVSTLINRSNSWSASLNQNLPTGAGVSLSYREGASDSNATNNALAQSVSDGASVSVRQPLLRGAGPRAAHYGIRSAALARTDEELAYRASVEQLVLDVSGAYWRKVAADESLRLAVRSREIAKQSVDDTRERFDEGFAGSADVAQVQRALGAARQSEVVAEAEALAAAADLRRQLGLEVLGRDTLRLVDRPQVPEVEPVFEEVLGRATASNASWLREKLALERATVEFRQSRNSALPDLSVNGSYGLSGLGRDRVEARQDLREGDNNDWRLGASVSVPLGFREPRASLSQARANRDVAELSYTAAEQDLHVRVQDAVRAVQRDRSRVSLAESTLGFAQQALAADQELLRDGRGAARDVVRSLEALDQAQVDRLRAEIDLQASLLELERVAGTLLQTMGLEGDSRSP